jgi:membrane protein YqaA with SNARE-associated domain
MHDWITQLVTIFSLPQYGLSTLFLVSFISATLLPLGSEPALFGLIKLRPDLFWAGIAVATAGNTLGGAVSWAMGRGSEQWLHGRDSHVTHRKALAWLGPQGLPSVLVTGRGRPTVCGGGLAQTSLLAVRGLHGHRQVGTLRGDDRWFDVDVSGQPVKTGPVLDKRHGPYITLSAC